MRSSRVSPPMAPLPPEPVRIGIVSIMDRASSGVYEDKGLAHRRCRTWLRSALINPIEFQPRPDPR